MHEPGERLLQERAGGVTRTERDAVIVLDKTKPGAGTVRLNYLVSNATWRPLYKLRAGAKDKDPVQLEYLATLTQQSGEDWTGVAVTLSTAEPLLNAAPPDLLALEVAVGAGPGGPMAQAAGQPGPGGGGGFGMPAPSAYLKSLEEQSKGLRGRAQDRLNKREAEAGGKDANDAAAIEQFRDLLISRDESRKT